MGRDILLRLQLSDEANNSCLMKLPSGEAVMIIGKHPLFEQETRKKKNSGKLSPKKKHKKDPMLPVRLDSNQLSNNEKIESSLTLATFLQLLGRKNLSALLAQPDLQALARLAGTPMPQ